MSRLEDVASSQAAAQLFADVVEHVRVGLHVWEAGGSDDPGELRLVYANPESGVALGVPTADVVGLTLREAFPPLSTTPIAAACLEVASTGVGRELGDVTYGDDRVVETVFSVSVFPLPGRRAGAAFTEVLRERRAESRLRDTLESRLRDTLESMSDAFFTLDEQWNFTYLNPQSEPILQRRREDLLGKNMWEEFPEGVGTVFQELYQRAVREQVTTEIEAYYEPLGKWLSVRAHPTRDGLAVHYQDVTARRNLEARLLQSQKLEAVGQLAGGVAHDFNNLLTVIEGYATLALSKVDDPGYVTGALMEIERASRRAGAVTSKLLAFSRREMLKTAVVDINEIVTSAFSLIGPLVGEQYTVQRHLEPEAGNVVTDVNQIEQVILNLVVNARDAMPGGGDIHLSTYSVPVGTAENPALGPGAYVALTVRDTGCGMDEKTLAQAFDPFFTTKPVGFGTGLGLSTAFGTIAQGGGQLCIESEPDVGTTVAAYFPRSPE